MNKSGNTTLTTRLATTLGSIRTTAVSLAAAALVVTLATPADAVERKFGPLDIFFDTTVSTGVSMRVAKRNEYYLPDASGGAVDMRPLSGHLADGTLVPFEMGGTAGLPGEPLRAIGTVASAVSASAENPDNFSGSTNNDDSRQNFDQWDLTSATTKMTNDILVNWGNHTLFARGTTFYDAILSEDSSYERSSISDGDKTQVAQDVDLLDLYISGNYDIGRLPVNIRLGNQVISWGEGTFLFNGINSINPLDVTAFRRPGAEIKEGLLPVWAAYTSIGLPFDLTLEAFYQFGHREYELDRGGTPFANSDVANPASIRGGNVGGHTFYSSSPYGGTVRRGCYDAGDYTTAGTQECGAFDFGVAAGDLATRTGTETAAQAWASITSPGDTADDVFAWNRRYDENADLERTNLGQIENIKLDNEDLHYFNRAEDLEPSDDGQYGLAMRWYSEALASTEFGFYHMNYHSRLPIASFRGTTPIISVGTTTPSTSAIGRQTGNAGCVGTLGLGTGWATAVQQTAAVAADATLATQIPGFLDPRLGKDVNAALGVTAVGPLGTMEFGGISDTRGMTPIYDPNDYVTKLSPLADEMVAQMRATLNTQITALMAGTSAQQAQAATLSGLYGRFLLTAGQEGHLDADYFESQDNTLRKMVEMNCVFTLAQSSLSSPGYAPTDRGGLSDALPNLRTGAEYLALNTQGDIFLEYPEDISLWGMSFNTTLGDWGVQGEVSYRENQPLQLDTDALTIGTIVNNCAFVAGGDTVALGFEPLNVNGESCLGRGNDALSTVRYVQGYKREEVWTAQVGTTALWYNSTPLVGALGGDQFIFLTEVGGIYVPGLTRPSYIGVTDTTARPGAVAAAGPQFANVCTSGSDLPLGGLLSIDYREDCRPDTLSWGYVLVGIMQYNNAFGTAWTMSPLVAWSHDVKGNSPSPFVQYRAGTKSLALRVTAEYQSTWRVALGYTDYLGNELRDVNLDRDFMALDISYAF